MAGCRLAAWCGYRCTMVGVATWLIASVVLHGMQSQQGSQPVRLAPAYPSSATPLN